MSKISKIIELNQEIYQYILSISIKENQILSDLRKETQKLPQARMQIAQDQAQLMSLLVKLIKAKRILEIGVFTGYSSLSMALASSEDTVIIACDINLIWTDIAKKYWQKAGIEHKIDLRLGEAQHTLAKLKSDPNEQLFDFVFIDADKSNYQLYFEESLALLRKGGLIVIDNVLWRGQVCDPLVKDKDTQSIRNFNQSLYSDARVDISVLSIADGLTLAFKK